MSSFKVIDDAIQQHGDKNFCTNKSSISEPPISWREFRDYYLTLVNFFEKIGLRSGGKVGIFSSTRIEWNIIDFACLYYGAITIGFYKNDRDKVIEYELRETTPDILFVENYDDLKKIQQLDSDWGWNKPVVILDASHSDAPPIYHFSQIIGGDAFHPSKLPVNEHPDVIASYIFTSGTTSTPKIAVLNQASLIHSAQVYANHYPVSSKDSTILYLPFSHVFSRVMFYASVLWGTEHIYESNPNNLASSLTQHNPSILLAVPRILEKVKNHIDQKISSMTLVGQILVKACINLSGYLQGNANRPSTLLLDLIDKALLKKFRAPFGNNIRFMGAGGGQLDPKVARFFYAIGIPVYEGYALTETGGLGVFNHPASSKIDSIGTRNDACEVVLANDGEIHISSPSNAVGYLSKGEISDLPNPYPTGDIAKQDKSGFLKIIGRKKEIIVTSNGKNISPSHIESALKANLIIEDAIVFGEGKPYLTAAIVINSDYGLDACDSEKVSEAIKKTNLCLSRHETIKQYFIAAPFEINSGTLTPTLKKRREAIQELYKNEIEHLYSQPVATAAYSS